LNSLRTSKRYLGHDIERLVWRGLHGGKSERGFRQKVLNTKIYQHKEKCIRKEKRGNEPKHGWLFAHKLKSMSSSRHDFLANSLPDSKRKIVV
jgi:hypothetical protein